jgi:hypothetical protein
MFKKIYTTFICIVTTPIAVVTGAAMMYKITHTGYITGLENEDFI